MAPPHPTLGTHARSPRPTRLRPRLRLRLRPRPLLPSPMTTPGFPSPSPPPPLLLLLLLLLSLLPHPSSSFACHSPFATVDGVVIDAPSSSLTSTLTHRRIVLRASTSRIVGGGHGSSSSIETYFPPSRISDVLGTMIAAAVGNDRYLLLTSNDDPDASFVGIVGSMREDGTRRRKWRR